MKTIAQLCCLRSWRNAEVVSPARCADNRRLRINLRDCYEWNEASFKVLEKAGYVLEDRLRHSAVRDGRAIDQWLHAFVAPE